MIFEVVQCSQHFFVTQWLRHPASPVLAFKCPDHEIVIQSTVRPVSEDVTQLFFNLILMSGQKFTIGR